MTPSVLAELGARPVAEVAGALGMTPGRRGSWGPCPACHAARRGSDERHARGPIQPTSSGAGWVCYRCAAKGDGGTLAALALVGVPRPDGDGMREVEAWASTHGLCLPRDGARQPIAYRPPPPPAPPPPPNYPPPGLLDEVRAYRPTDAGEVVRVVAWQRSRGLGDLSLWPRARIAARGARGLVPPYYPLVVPLCDAAGVTRSVHCRRADERAPKTRSPTGYDVRGLFFADTVALRMLRGTPPGAGCVIVVEGVTDYLRACLIAPPDVAVLGGISGSFEAIGALACLPTDVWVATDADRDRTLPDGRVVRSAGDRYAEQVAAGCPRAARVRPPDGQDIDSAGWTWDDVVRVAVF